MGQPLRGAPPPAPQGVFCKIDSDDHLQNLEVTAQLGVSGLNPIWGCVKLKMCCCCCDVMPAGDSIGADSRDGGRSAQLQASPIPCWLSRRLSRASEGGTVAAGCQFLRMRVLCEHMCCANSERGELPRVPNALSGVVSEGHAGACRLQCKNSCSHGHGGHHAQVSHGDC